MSDFAKDRYFNGYSNNRSVQENFNLITSFIQESAKKHISSKTSMSTSSSSWHEGASSMNCIPVEVLYVRFVLGESQHCKTLVWGLSLNLSVS